LIVHICSWPAAYEECISVAAVQKRNGLPVATFSSSNAAVDYSGIGVNVLSLKPGGDVMRLSGTSMACPHVAGFVACLLSKSKATERPEDEIITTDPGAFCGWCGGGNNTAVNNNATAPNSLFGIEDDSALRKVVNEKFLVDIGITGPDNETGLGFLTYLSKDELMKLF
jgi:Subtilisin-like serine proteases